MKAALVTMLVIELWTVTLVRRAATVMDVAKNVLVMCLRIHATPVAMRMTLMLMNIVNIASLMS
jgi:hypothetical protein